jgi:MFS family permease
MQKREKEARVVLLRINETESDAIERLLEIQEAANSIKRNEDGVVWRELFNPNPSLRRMLITGCGIQCFQQITGIYATVYYSPTIFRDAGIQSDKEILAATVAVGFIKTMFILVAIFLIDRVGRKPLLYISTIGMTACLDLLGIALAHQHGSGLVSSDVGVGLAIFVVCGNVAFFSVGVGPIC